MSIGVKERDKGFRDSIRERGKRVSENRAKGAMLAFASIYAQVYILYIYIKCYIEKERERTHTHSCIINVCACIYSGERLLLYVLYIYAIYADTQRQSKTARERRTELCCCCC